MTKKLLQLYSLKWNPFAPDVPVDALFATPRIDSFTWRVEQLAREGGFAAILGEPGTGKSVTLPCSPRGLPPCAMSSAC